MKAAPVFCKTVSLVERHRAGVVRVVGGLGGLALFAWLMLGVGLVALLVGLGLGLVVGVWLVPCIW